MFMYLYTESGLEWNRSMVEVIILSFSHLVFQYFEAMIADPADFAKPFKHLDLN